MARLRNRIVKAEFWTDPELLRWPRDKRETYRGLWAIAEDSGCLEDDPFGWKLLLWPSPMDADITVDVLTQWRDEFIDSGKLIPYGADGKRYLFVKNFHQHEHPRNPQQPDLPLPACVIWEANAADHRKGRYVVAIDLIQGLYNDVTTVPVLPCPAQSGPAQSGPDAHAREALADPLVGLCITELPVSESTKEDYKRTLDRYRGKLNDEHIERIVCQLGNWRPAKPINWAEKKVHLTLAAWLNKEPRDALRPEHEEFKPAAEQTPAEREAAKIAAKEAVDRVQAMIGQTIGRAM